MLFTPEAKKQFHIEPITSMEMDALIGRCANVYAGKPEWIDGEHSIKTINFAKAVCSETARLAVLGIGIKIDGSVRAGWLQEQINGIYYQLRSWTEYGCAYGTVILKPNGSGIDMVTPDRFAVTDQSNGQITGIVFHSREISGNGKQYYNRLEYHRWDDNGAYLISNRCYVADTPTDKGKLIPIDKTPWAGLSEEIAVEHIDRPLFGVLKMPHANNVDIDSPLGMPVFADAIEEFKDLDIAYSRNAEEIYNSERITLVDDRLISKSGQPVRGKSEIELPRYVKKVFGNDVKEFYEEINPQLNTDTRLSGINALLSQIGYKCGFSNGYFVFNESTGIQTATGVEAEQQRTIQLVKDVRDKLESCLDGLIYALNAFADLYDLAPLGEYEVTYDFGDITYNREEDKARWYGYVTAGKIPFWYYLVKFEGLTEDGARALEKEAQPDNPQLFGEE